MLLNLLFTLLSFGLFIILLSPQTKINFIKNFSLIISGLCLLISVLILVSYDSNNINFQFIIQSNIFRLNFLNIDFIFGLDSLSIYFCVLTSFLIFLCIIFIWDEPKFKSYVLLLLFLYLLLLLTFSVLNLLLFYLLFECILIPIYLVIGIWGSREKKIRASYLLFFYTVCGSLLFLISILYIYSLTGSFNFEYLMSFNFNFEQQILIWIAFFISFASKIPMFPFYIWLPEAHVEAPTVGSVLLAGILLKLGVYGFIRFSLPLFPEASLYFSPFVFILSIVGVILASFAAIKQTDLKKIIAYSSIAHMNLVVLGIFSGNIIGIQGAILQSVSHGFVSSALFFLVGILYKYYHSRLIYYYGGLVSVMPLYSLFFLFFTLSNIALPGTSSFVGEFLILLGVFQKSVVCAVFAAISVILSGAYSLWVYNRLIFGNLKTEFLVSFFDLNCREFFIIFCLFLPSLYLGVFPSDFLSYINLSVIKIFIINNVILI
jgi:proton-translocating NADH-quinone oxidoreductase chain M